MGQKKEGTSYIILYESEIADPTSKGFARCYSLQETFDIITKLGIYLCQNENSKENTFSLRSIINALKTLPYLKIYQSPPNSNMGQLKEISHFCNQYRTYFKRICGEAQHHLQMLEQVFKSQQKSRGYFQKLQQSNNISAEIHNMTLNNNQNHDKKEQII